MFPTSLKRWQRGGAIDDGSPAALALLSIAAVERDSGLSKDTLRVWERRYGFPAPARDAVGERVYPLAQVEKLRVIKRLLDAGHRPGRVVPLALEQLQALADPAREPLPRNPSGLLADTDVSVHLALIRSHDTAELRTGLTRLLLRLGVARFITDAVAPLNLAVGDAWIRGQMEVFEEHLYTETLQIVLRQAIAGVPAPPAGGGPRVLLTTFPGEQHVLGLLMAEAVLAVEGCRCMSLGVQAPLWDIVRAAQVLDCDIVALSFTGCMSPNQIFDGLSELRGKLSPHVRLWVGGSAPVLQRRRLEGVDSFGSLDEVPAALRRWREQTREQKREQAGVASPVVASPGPTA